ncbi:heme-degrading monooxygenase HmoA [Stenotrophomonas rhizophila]|uniref:antibiotic biosynthesis monooxygenase family protein n=1 Tax=Stenotrophomonas rhizophila TaxID=216778 RepID=UPI0033944B1C
MSTRDQVTELAWLSIQPGQGAAFEAAFASVASLVSSAEGHIRHRLVSAVDRADAYLLEVDWTDLAAHVERFEPSDAHARFMASIEPFLAAEPLIIHVPCCNRSG